MCLLLTRAPMSLSHWGEALLRFRDALGVWRLPSFTLEELPES